MASKTRLLRFGVLTACTAVAGAAMLLGGADGGKAVDPTHRPGVVAEGAAPGDGGGPTTLRPAAGDPAPAATYEPDEVLVANAPADFRTRAGAIGYRVVETLTLPHLGLQVLRVRLPVGVAVPVGIARLRARFPQVIVDANHHYRGSVGLGAGGLPRSFARAAIGWTRLPEDCGRNLRLGMIDAGVDVRHAALQGARIRYRAFHRATREPGPADHGTAVAALMVGQPGAAQGLGGLVPGASLYAANIFEITPAGRSVATARGLLGAVDWLIGERVDVLNLSIAGPDNRVVKQAIDRATRGGLTLVAAAGNWGHAAPPAYPAAYDDVIAVTAVAPDRRVYSHANSGGWIDFAAPGVRLWTAVPGGGRYQSGTSFASPYVAVRAAAAVASGAGRGAAVLRRQLRAGTLDLGRPGRDDVFGWGLITAPPAC